MERGDSLGHLGHLAAITPNLDKIVKENAVIHRFSIEIMVGPQGFEPSTSTLARLPCTEEH